MQLDRPTSQASEDTPGTWLPVDCEPGLVSVLIPTFNRAAFLAETLGSVLAQSYEQVEVVAVDDGSTDDTQEILVGWQRRFERERGWRFQIVRQQNQGGPAARNRAARECRGQWLIFFDDDDLMATEMINGRMLAMSQPHADIVYGPHAFFTTDGPWYWLGESINAEPRAADQEPLLSWMQGWDWGLQASMISRSLINQIGPWNESLRRGQDLDYKLRMLEQSPSAVHASSGLVFIRHHGQSVSADRSSQAQTDLMASLERLEKHAVEKYGQDACRESLADLWGQRAIRCYQEGAITAGRYCAEKANSHDANHRPHLSAIAEKVCFAISGYRGLGWARRVRKQLSYLVRRFLGFSAGTLRRVEFLPLEESKSFNQKPLERSVS